MKAAAKLGGLGLPRKKTWIELADEQLGLVNNNVVNKIQYYVDQAKWGKWIFRNALEDAVNKFNNALDLGTLAMNVESFRNRWDQEHPEKPLSADPFEQDWTIDEDGFEELGGISFCGSM